MDKGQQKIIQNIVSEAENEKGKSNSVDLHDLQRQIRESEKKRLKLAEALHESRYQLQRFAELGDLEEDKARPFGYFVAYGKNNEEGQTAIIRYHGRLYETNIKIPTNISEEIKPRTGTFHQLRQRYREKRQHRVDLYEGELLLLDNDLQVIEPRGFELISGCLGTVEQVLSSNKLLIKTVGDETILVSLAHPMKHVKILPGDNVEYDPDSLFVYSVFPKTSVDHLAIENVPDINYADIGGLEKELEEIRDAIELPYLYPEYFREHKLIPPKGILLYGPPGCGKTLIAKAVANSLATRIGEKTGVKRESFFFNVKGPELLNKYVGETEQAIRDLFARARNQASYHTPVIIFFDEMDSLFRARGSGISSDMESTIVPQFLAELDGLEVLRNVFLIGATNREDLIDPAVLRPGRFDRKIRIPRPDRKAAIDIFSKYLTADLPLDESIVRNCGGKCEAVEWMIYQITDEMFDTTPHNAWLEVTYSSGRQKILFLKDLCSGAIIESIVNRAKFIALKNFIKSGEKGITLEHLREGMKHEFRENEDLSACSNPSEWMRIIGKSGEGIIRIRPLWEKWTEGPGNKPKKTVVVNVGDRLS